MPCQKLGKTKRKSCYSRFRSFGVDSARTIMCNLISYALPFVNARIFGTFSFCQKTCFLYTRIVTGNGDIYIFFYDGT